MTDEEVAALKAESEANKKAAEEATKALTEKEGKISQLNSALHEERSKSKEPKETVVTPVFDEEKIKQVAAQTTSELLYKNEISKFLKEVSGDEDERKLIEARFEQMRGSETDPNKLKDIILDAKFVTERRKGGRSNTSSLGSSAGGRDNGYSDDREDNSRAKKMGNDLFGIDPKKADDLSKPIDLRN